MGHAILTGKKGFVAGILAALMVFLVACATTPDGGDATSGASPVGAGMPAIAFDIVRPAPEKRVLVVYFSQGSSTRRVADDLALILDAETERIIEKKSRTGLFGFIGAGADSSMGASTPIETPVHDPGEFDMVVVCTPVWAWRLVPPVRTWLGLMRGRLPDCVYVAVSSATAPDKIVAAMEAASGKAPVASAGFVRNDFDSGNRALYEEKIRTLVGTMR